MCAGTTALCNHLADEENRFLVPKMGYLLGPDWYRSQFESDFTKDGEVLPNYAMCHLWMGVPARIKDTLPDVKLVFVARDRVDRFLSHYRTRLLDARHLALSCAPPLLHYLTQRMGGTCWKPVDTQPRHQILMLMLLNPFVRCRRPKSAETCGRVKPLVVALRTGSR
jgi:hypothetical protein